MAAKVRNLDFTGVKDGGDFRPRRKREGDYFAHIVKVDDHKSKAGNDSWVFTIKVDGDARAAYAYYVNTDDEKQLWKARQLFIAAGLKVGQARVKADPNKLVGKALGIALEDDEYEGKVKSTIAAVFPTDDIEDGMNDASLASTKAKASAADEDDDEDDEDDEPAPVKKSKAKTPANKPAPVEDDEDEDEDDDEDEPPAKPVKGKASKAKPVVEDDDEDDEDEDDEPPVKKSKAKAKPAKAKKKPVDDDDDDDELDLDEL